MASLFDLALGLPTIRPLYDDVIMPLEDGLFDEPNTPDPRDTDDPHALYDCEDWDTDLHYRRSY